MQRYNITVNMNPAGMFSRRNLGLYKSGEHEIQRKRKQINAREGNRRKKKIKGKKTRD